MKEWFLFLSDLNCYEYTVNGKCTTGSKIKVFQTFRVCHFFKIYLMLNINVELGPQDTEPHRFTAPAS
jgi:hypothetical protein